MKTSEVRDSLTIVLVANQEALNRVLEASVPEDYVEAYLDM